MNKILKVVALLAMASGFLPTPLFAQSASKSFQISVTIPEHLELSVPSRVRSYESSAGALLLRINDFRTGHATNLGKKIDACTVLREFGGQRFRVFTLTAL